MHTKSLIKWLTGAGFLAAWVVLSILTGPEHQSEPLLRGLRLRKSRSRPMSVPPIPGRPRPLRRIPIRPTRRPRRRRIRSRRS